MREIEARAKLYERAGEGDKVIVTEGQNVTLFVNSK